MGIRKKAASLTFVLFSAFMLLAYTAAAKDLIAIVGTDTSTMNKAEVVVALGSEKGLTFVERAELDKVLAEHKLSLSGMIDPRSAIKIGKLLRADIVTQIIKSKEKLPERIIIFDVTYGIRLEDKFIKNKNFDADVAEITNTIVNAVNKSKAIKSRQAKFILFLPINMISREKDVVESASLAQLYLKQNLVSQEKIVLLERDLVDLLLQEKLINRSAILFLKICNFAVELEAKIVDSKINVYHLPHL